MRRGVIGVPGIWRGRVWGKGWDRGGQFRSNLRPRLTDLSQLGGFQVSRRGSRGEQKRDKGKAVRGKQKQGECAIYIVICARVHKRMLETFE